MTKLLIMVVIAIGTIASLPISEASAHYPSRAWCMTQAKAQPDNNYEYLKKCRKWRVVHNCWHVRPIVTNIRVKGVVASRHQRKVMSRIVQFGRKMKMSRRHIIAALATATQEQTMNNKSYGHGTSVGAFQLISIHGTVTWRMKLENSSGWFYRGVRRVNQSGSIGQLAQRVQRSAYPSGSLYQQWVPESKRSLKKYLGPANFCVT